MNYNELLAGLSNNIPRDNTRYVPTAPEVKKPSSLSNWAPRQTYLSAPGNYSQSTVQKAEQDSIQKADVQRQKNWEDNAETRAENQKLIQGAGFMLDPLGSIADDIFGDEQSIARYLVEYADIPLGLAKTLATAIFKKVVASGTVAAGKAAVGTVLSAAAFGSLDASDAKKLARAIESAPVDVNKLNAHLQELPKVASLNHLTTDQMTRVAHDGASRGATQLKKFPSEYMRVADNVDILGDGSHRFGDSQARQYADLLAGRNPVPVITNEIDMNGFSHYGKGEGQEYLAMRGGRQAMTNKEAASLAGGGTPREWSLPLVDPVSKSKLSADEIRDMGALKQKNNTEMTFEEYLHGMFNSPTYKGKPRFRQKGDLILPEFGAESKLFNNDDMKKYMYGKKDQNILNPSILQNNLDDVGSWKEEIPRSLGLGVKFDSKYKPVQLHEYGLSLLGNNDLFNNSKSMVMRHLGGAMDSGDLQGLINGNPNPFFLREADEVLQKTISDQAILAGEVNPIKPKVGEAAWIRANKEAEYAKTLKLFEFINENAKTPAERDLWLKLFMMK